MELQELYDLMERFASSGLTQLKWKQEDEEITLCCELTVVQEGATPVVVTPSVSVPKAEEGELVQSPLVGIFYAAPAPGEAPFVTPGKEIKKGETLCLIEAMKMMSEVLAPADCVVEAVLAKDGEPVGYGDPLLRIRRG